MKKHLYPFVLLAISSISANAYHTTEAKQSRNIKKTTAGCTNPSAKVELDLYNVRTTIMTGGDMWWDLSKAKYEVPKGTGRQSMFTGELWIGGLDDNQQLCVAAQLYRQSGNDFWPGPLDTSSASIDQAVCNQYDKIWKVNRLDVKNFSDSVTAASTDMLSWPGNGNTNLGQSKYLAPFFDKNADGIYNSADGDYPLFELNANNTYTIANKSALIGDQALWWVFNDKGNIHSESTGNQIGLEIQATAYVLSDGPDKDVKNMTFYRYKIINRGSLTLSNTYFGVLADVDLGNWNDDYLGCDANLGLGYCYNGDNVDQNNGTVLGYSTIAGAPTTPPAVGIDFFEGPFADANDKDDPKDSTRSGIGYGDGIIDNERLGMSKFIYFDNANSPTGNPSAAVDYYNYLQGIWRDSKRMTYGGNGRDVSTDYSDYMFSDSSDIKSGRNVWTEITAGNNPGDRRFLETTGPFTLKPGAVNYIQFVVIWAQADSGNAFTSVKNLKDADEKAQTIFDGKVITAVAAPAYTKTTGIAFPNPFSTQTQIYINPAAAKTGSTLRVLDMTGRCVKILYNIQAGYVTIDRAGLNAGTYFYQVENNSKPITQGKLVIE